MKHVLLSLSALSLLGAATPAQHGRGVIYDVNYQTGTFGTAAVHNWQKIWHQIVPGNFDGSGSRDLLFYSREGGAGEVLQRGQQGWLEPDEVVQRLAQHLGQDHPR